MVALSDSDYPLAFGESFILDFFPAVMLTMIVLIVETLNLTSRRFTSHTY